LKVDDIRLSGGRGADGHDALARSGDGAALEQAVRQDHGPVDEGWHPPVPNHPVSAARLTVSLSPACRLLDNTGCPQRFANRKPLPPHESPGYVVTPLTPSDRAAGTFPDEPAAAGVLRPGRRLAVHAPQQRRRTALSRTVRPVRGAATGPEPLGTLLRGRRQHVCQGVPASPGRAADLRAGDLLSEPRSLVLVPGDAR